MASQNAENKEPWGALLVIFLSLCTMTRSSLHKKELVLAYGCRGTRARHGRIGMAASSRHGGRSRKQDHLQPRPWRGRKVEVGWDYKLSRKLPVGKHSSCNTAALSCPFPNSTMSWEPGIKIPKPVEDIFSTKPPKALTPSVWNSQIKILD